MANTPRTTTPTPSGRRHAELPSGRLRRRLDPKRLPFDSTAEVAPLVGTIGQPRALRALEYGLEVHTRGFNLFVAGEPGSGRLTTVLDLLRTRAAELPAPDDWIYVHNFRNPDRPNAIRMKAGRGAELRGAIDELIEVLKREIPRAFESEEYEHRRRETLAEIAKRRQQLDERIARFAAERGLALQVTVTGVASVPLADGRPISPEQFEALPPERQEAIARAMGEVQEEGMGYAHQVRHLEKEAVSRVRELDRQVALFVIGPLLHELEVAFGDNAEVLAHLQDVMAELLAHLNDFREEQENPLPFAFPSQRDHARFRVNVLVDNSETEGAPVVVEHNPTYYNLLGQIEYRSAFGAVITDFREIKPGALHSANGGFLVLDVADVLRHPFAWEALKRALRSAETRIENLLGEFSPAPTATLRPEPIPLDVKVVLLGSQMLYRLLYQLDEDVRELFKVKAEFSAELDWSPQHHRSYAAFVSRWVRENGLLHFDRAAVARVIEHGARLREDQRKLSARLIEISDVVSEASFWAAKNGHTLVRAEDVAYAARQRDYRSGLLEERARELIDDGTIVIDTAGERVGEVNGIAILDVGDYSFGRPCRVSARTALGRGGIQSIERAIELSGPIHSKGFMILAGFLAATYAQEWPLSISATLTFEQSYDEIDGDSASSTELYALLSAISGLGLRQSIGVTGSVDQNGNVQAVGGVTRKVEGFFATCKARGLAGTEGVIVPRANVHNLMLDDEVVDAVANGSFHVWPVRTIDQGIEILTGRRAGRRRADGTYPPDSVHGCVEARLAEYASRLRAFGEPPPEKAAGPGRNSRS